MRDLLDDHVGRMLYDRDVQMVFRKHKKALEEIFRGYANPGSVAGGALKAPGAAFLKKLRAKTRPAMPLAVWSAMLKEGGFLDAHFTPRDGVAVFAKVALASEASSGQPTFDSPVEAQLADFGLVVARLAKAKVLDSYEPFEDTLDSFLTLRFVPIFRKLLAKRAPKQEAAEPG